MSAKHEKSLWHSFRAYRLPRGRHDLSPEFVAESQRWRLLGAAAEVLAERGYVHTSSAEIASRAGVSSSTFYQHFGNVDLCLLAAYEMAADCVCELVSGACENAPATEWPARLLSAIDAVLAFLASESSLAHLLGPAVPAAVPAAVAARDRLIERLVALLRTGRALRGETAPDLPGDTERRLLGAAVGLLSDRVLGGEAESLPDLAPQLAAILSARYLPIVV